MDYTDIGLTPNLNSVNSLVNQNNENITEYVDEQVGEILRPGGILYSQVNYPGRGVKAVVSLNPSGGAFDNIQTAVNYVNGLGGGDIYITPGNYIIDYNITLVDNTSLYGFNSSRTFLNYNGGTNIITLGTGNANLEDSVISGIEFSGLGSASCLFNVVGINNVKFQNLNIDCGTRSTGTFYVFQSNGGFFEDVSFERINTVVASEGTAVFIKSDVANSISFLNCNFSGGDTFLEGTIANLYLRDSSIQTRKSSLTGIFEDAILDHNTIQGGGTNTIYFREIGDVNIVNNYISGDGALTGTIMSLNNVDFSKISDNDIFIHSGSYTALSLENTSNTSQISNNSIKGIGTGQTSLKIGTAASDVSNISVTGNIFYPADGAGTITNNGTNTLIANNLLAI